MLNFIRNLPGIVVLLLAAAALYVFGATDLLGNKWFGLALCSAFAGLLVGVYGNYSNGSTLAGENWWQNYGNPVLSAMLYAAVCYVPLGILETWVWFKDPIYILGLPWVLAIIILIRPTWIAPAVVLPWGPLMASSALLMRWGYWALAEGKHDPKLVFTTTAGIPKWVFHVVFSIGSIALGLLVAGWIVLIVLVCKGMSPLKFMLYPAHANTAAVFTSRVGRLIFIGDHSAIHIHHFTDPHLAQHARDAGHFHQVHNLQLWGGRGEPPLNTLDWTEADWQIWYGDATRLTTLAERLDVSAFLTPGLMCLPQGFYPGLPGLVSPYEHIEPGFEPIHHGHGAGVEYIDLRPDPPRQQVSRQIVLEHGLEATIEVSYRVRPVWLDLVCECKGRQVLLTDAVDYAMNQIAQVVGPWMYGFLGDPMADPAMGHVQRGLVVEAPARPATPLSRQTSMVNPANPVNPLTGLPNLVAANRPEFLMVRAIIVALTIRVLRSTGLHIFDVQVDDVNVPPEVAGMLSQAVAAIIGNSVLPELANAERAVMEARIGGIYDALARDDRLSAEDITKVLVEAAKLLPLKGSSMSSILMTAGSNAGVVMSADAGKEGGKK